MKNKSVLICGSIMACAVISICAFNFNDSKLIADQIAIDNEKTSGVNAAIHSIANTLTISTQQLAIANSAAKGYTGSNSMTQEDINLIMMSENDLWKLMSDGVYTSRPGAPFSSHEARLNKIRQDHEATIEVDIWYWEDPSDDTNLNKVAVKKKLQVHNALADIFTHVFNDAFNDPEQPVYDIADTGAGTWVIRGIKWDPARAPSGHAYGAAIDINPETYVVLNGVKYGNCLSLDPIPPDKFDSLPESHKKYQLMVDGKGFCKYFKKYGFLWGAEYKTADSDPMHFCFIGDSKARETGQKNFEENK